MEKCTTGAYNVLVVKENTPKAIKNKIICIGRITIMRLVKKVTAAAMASAMALSLAACGGGNTATTAAPTDCLLYTSRCV